jgi:hypothetical protein
VQLITLSCLDTEVKEFLKQRWETQYKVVDIRIGRTRDGIHERIFAMGGISYFNYEQRNE